MVMTRRGVYHNLSDSEYATSNNEVALFFSSRFYMDKFLNEYGNHRIEFRKKIAKAMNVDEFNLDLLADVNFYKETEKRGFRAISKGGEMEWQELRLYALAQMTEKNTNDWQETQKLRLDGQRKNTV